uniref:Ras association domain family member 1 n=1 Tax=Oncorhynchus mykiss TaxID=8022 RepID=A0A8C7PAG0_ONCMY
MEEWAIIPATVCENLVKTYRKRLTSHFTVRSTSVVFGSCDTCHYQCRPFIQLDYITDRRLLTTEQTDVSEDTMETDTNVDENDVDILKQHLKTSVRKYNLTQLHQLYGSYTGFIRVLLKLTRPVSLPPPWKASSPQESGQLDGGMKCRTSFYLPKDTAKHLHIGSRTQVREVIEALLNKFTVVDKPAKFALFERSEHQNQIYLRKLSDDERPLHLLVLKENETGEVNVSHLQNHRNKTYFYEAMANITTPG